MTTSSSDLVLGWPAWRAAAERSDAQAVPATPLPARRLLSLDVFRGFVIASMLLVNNLIWNASTPRQLMHAPWGRGVTFTDMILPWFVFIVGVTIPVSVAASRERRAGRIARIRGGRGNGLGGSRSGLRLRPGGGSGGAQHESERQGQQGAATSAGPAVHSEAVHYENEFQFQYHEIKLPAGCRPRRRPQSPFTVISVTLACAIYQYGLHQLIESYSYGPS